MSRVVKPETRVLHISDNETLTVRKRLTTGEKRAAFGRMYVTAADGKTHVNPTQTGMATVTAYLVDWTVKNDDGTILGPIRGLPIAALEQVLDSLDYDDFTEIKEAIEKHEEAMIAERAQEKKDRAGEARLSAT